MADAETDELSRVLAKSRARLSRHAAALAERANIAHRLRTSVRRKPVAWIAAAVVIGLLIAARRSRVRHTEVRVAPPPDNERIGKAAIAIGAGKLALEVLRPTLTAWLRQKVSSHTR